MMREMYLDLIDRKSLSTVFFSPVTIFNGVLARIEELYRVRVTYLKFDMHIRSAINSHAPLSSDVWAATTRKLV